MVEAPSTFNVRQAAKRIKRDRVTVQRWLREGLPHERPSEYDVRIREDDLTLWLRTKLTNQRASRFGERAA
ncbi:hypothetical protein [Rathayibacter sp. AY1D9]|uniref:hypothetical protein n=1 Tax=Rathayibacter sp. AY1D9 TaxID=2080548 RepID=UPI000D422471|nr:hypothetical protein [Rathayibacter sp. AY1D9]PPH84882.1 hypothetical protein C5C50_00910 [Rathayibacter sp. AY1D9]